MKVYIVSDGKLNNGYEATIKCVCASEELATHFVKAFSEYNLSVTEYEVVQ